MQQNIGTKNHNFDTATYLKTVIEKYICQKEIMTF